MPEPTSSSTLPTSDQPTSMDNDSTMDITSVSPNMRLGGSEALSILNPLEKQAVGVTHDPPPTTSVAFIGINYIPDSADSPMSSHRLPPHPTPWESVALQSVDGDAVTGHSSFPPKPQVKRSVPISSYYFGPPPADSAFFTPPVGQIGVHHPREIVRVERDYSGGEIVQFSSTYPLEFEGRITPTQFLESINAVNEILISASSLRHSVFDNCIEIFSLQLSRLFLSTHYEREMNRLRRHMDDLNHRLFNPTGLNILWPRKVGFLFLEIEYY
ncbi:Golgin subfamily A member 7/ERF4 family-domain-containing protein [Lactarius pseudohatsudake]|nr:Golgin subfamily A member 7/ERF4 family-domain-containing protein [Lactarius pseudohatsudake]